jgi:hypothetical protein
VKPEAWDDDGLDEAGTRLRRNPKKPSKIRLILEQIST